MAQSCPAPTDHPAAWSLGSSAAPGRSVEHLAADLRRYGMPVTVIDPRAQPNADMEFISGDATDPDVLVQTRLSDAVALAAASDNDISNLSVLAEAQRES